MDLAASKAFSALLRPALLSLTYLRPSSSSLPIFSVMTCHLHQCRFVATPLVAAQAAAMIPVSVPAGGDPAPDYAVVVPVDSVVLVMTMLRRLRLFFQVRIIFANTFLLHRLPARYHTWRWISGQHLAPLIKAFRASSIATMLAAVNFIVTMLAAVNFLNLTSSGTLSLLPLLS